MKYYLAGGAIRNFLLGKQPTDFDFVFDSTAQAFIDMNPGACKLGTGHTYSLEGQEFSPMTNGSIRQDLYARDFTINSFLLAENGMLHMHERALSDLKNRIIHPTSDQALNSDPLRIFRAARFCSEFPDFTLSDDCLQLMREAANSAEFKKIPAERVGRECLKAMRSSKPGNFLRILDKANALTYWFQELEGARTIPAGPPKFHQTDVLEHIASTMDRAVLEIAKLPAQKSPGCNKVQKDLTSLTVWMSLCHDIGKTLTPEKLWPHHYQHELRGVRHVVDLAKRLRLPARYRTAGVLSTHLHMKAGHYLMLRPATRVDLLMEADSKKLLTPLFLVAQADSGQTDLLHIAQQELEIILNISLPEHWQNKGKDSGRHLRELRCSALPKRPLNSSARP